MQGNLQFDGLMQDCDNANTLAMELLPACTKPLNCIDTETEKCIIDCLSTVLSNR